MNRWKCIAAAMGTAFVIGAAQTVPAAEVVVLRGDSRETVAVDREERTVLRGGGSLRAMPASQAETNERTRVAAGRTLWILDVSGRPTTACYLIRTEYFSGHKIRCTSQTY